MLISDKIGKPKSLGLKSDGVRRVAFSVASVLLAVAIGGILLKLFGLSAWDGLHGLVVGSFGSLAAIDTTLFMATPIISTGLAVAIAQQAGLFNVGAEGQLYFGAFAATLVGIYLGDLPAIIVVPVAFIVGAAAGAALAAVAAALKNWLGAHEVITTIMLNFIAIEFTSYLVNYHFQVPGGLAPQTPEIGPGAVLPPLFRGYQVSGMFFIAIFLLGLYALMTYRSRLGFEIRAVGASLGASEAAGINPYRTRMLAMVLSGAFAGLAGAGEVLGNFGRFIDRFSPGYGFDGVTVAIMGQGHPLGILAGALVVGGLRSAGTYLDLFTKIPIDFAVLLQGLIILLITAPKLIQSLGNLGRRWRRG